MAQAYTRQIVFTADDTQLKRATDRLFQSLDRIEKKLDIIAGRKFKKVVSEVEQMDKVLKELNKTSTKTRSIYSGLGESFRSVFAGTTVALNIFKKGVKEIEVEYLRLSLMMQKPIKLGRRTFDADGNMSGRTMSRAAPGSPYLRNELRLGRNTEYWGAAGMTGDYYAGQPFRYGGSTFQHEMRRRSDLRREGYSRAGSGYAAWDRNVTYETEWQKQFRARLQDQVDRRRFNQAKNLQVQTGRLSEAGGGVFSGADIRVGAADPVAKSIRRNREKMEKLRRVELKTTKQLLGVEKQIVTAKKAQVDSTAYAPGAVGPQQAPIWNRLGFGKNANKKGIFANSKGIGGRLAGASSSAMIGGGFPLLFGQGGLSALGGGLGGALGGMLGGGFGFGLSIVGTAVATKIDETMKYRKALSDLSKDMKTMGLDAGFSAKQVNKLAKSLDVTKEEALEISRGFKRFGAKKGGLFAEYFGGDLASFTATAGAIDIQSAMAAIKQENKDLTLEDELRYSILVRQLGAEEAINKIMEDRVQKKTKELEIDQSKNKIWKSFKQWISGTAPLTALDAVQNEEMEKLFEKNKALLDGFNETREQFKQLGLEAEKTAQSITTAIESVEKELRKLMNPEYQIVEMAKSIDVSFQEAFKGVIRGSMSAQQALASMFQRTANAFLDMAAQMLAAQIRARILGIFGSMFGFTGGKGVENAGPVGFEGVKHYSGKAAGGPVTGGSPYIVGEKGPELFVPNSSGNIVPNHAMGGSMVVNVDASGSSVEGDDDRSRQLGELIGAAVQSEIVRQQRPGGTLY